MKYPELEGAHKDYQSPTLGPTGDPQESQLVPESIIQMLPEFCQA